MPIEERIVDKGLAEANITFDLPKVTEEEIKEMKEFLDNLPEDKEVKLK